MYCNYCWSVCTSANFVFIRKQSVCFFFADVEGSHPISQERFPARGWTAHQPPARAHREVLRSLRGRRPAHHGLWVHEARRPQQVPQVSGCGKNPSDRFVTSQIGKYPIGLHVSLGVFKMDKVYILNSGMQCLFHYNNVNTVTYHCDARWAGEILIDRLQLSTEVLNKQQEVDTQVYIVSDKTLSGEQKLLSLS